MKHSFFYKPAVSLLVAAFFALAACSDPIFYTIAQEVAPIEALIKGSPSNFVFFKDVLYVGSGSTLHWYNGRWNDGSIRVPQPGGIRIKLLAVAGNSMYALCYLDGNKDSAVIMRYDETVWVKLDKIPNYNIQYIYAAPNSSYVFIGAERPNENSFAVFYTDNGGQITLTSDIPPDKDTSELFGAAYDENNYYLCTRGGIYYATDPGSTFTLIQPSAGSSLGNDFTGIINTGSIVAIDRGTIGSGNGGKLYTIESSGTPTIKNTGISLDKFGSTGALAIWEDPLKPGSRLLLAGRTPTGLTSYTNGYVEVDLDTTGKPFGEFREPGIGDPSSVLDGANGRYQSSIGRLVITSIFQAPRGVDSGMRLFASTQGDGVYSYRSRNGVYQWNAED